MILVVDDEPGIRESLVYALERDGFATQQASNLAGARSHESNSQLIVLDLMLPDGSGLEYLKELRSRSRVPVIVLTSRDQETDRVVGLELGADDYVTKPFSPRELVARVRAVLRRIDTPNKVPVQGDIKTNACGFSLNPAKRTAACNKRDLTLSKTEFDLLKTSLTPPGHVFSRQQLLDMFWGQDWVVGDRTVDDHIKSLRKKVVDIGGPAQAIETH